MALSDVLYPGNPERRMRVAMLHQELVDCMELSFDATNNLIDVLNTHWPCQLPPIKLNEKGTIKENADVFLAAMKSIQDVLQDVDKMLASKLEPTLYQKLHDFQETDTTKMKILRSVKMAEKAIGPGASLIFGTLIYSKAMIDIQNKIIASILKLGTSVLGGLVAGVVLGLAVDLIVSAISGAVERKELEEEIQKLQQLVNELKPVSKEYNTTIIEVKLICQQELLKCK